MGILKFNVNLSCINNWYCSSTMFLFPFWYLNIIFNISLAVIWNPQYLQSTGQLWWKWWTPSLSGTTAAVIDRGEGVEARSKTASWARSRGGGGGSVWGQGTDQSGCIFPATHPVAEQTKTHSNISSIAWSIRANQNKSRRYGLIIAHTLTIFIFLQKKKKKVFYTGGWIVLVGELKGIEMLKNQSKVNAPAPNALLESQWWSVSMDRWHNQL